MHSFTFSITDAVVETNPDVTEMAAVIANNISKYIKAHVEREAAKLKESDEILKESPVAPDPSNN